ncbi:hypothetical protein J7E87_26785 [Streptomyces sp. ISL-1]|uniref:MEDS domain-containing protein n=1 Tax=Streptomyces sp. ISL-1 TaxID=2817657 RepID=UPI001BE5EFD1|nr:hypothetical protein [Streptomyces sp. ISL-1]
MAVPFAEEGLTAGEPVLAVTTAANIQLLRDALGQWAGALDTADTAYFGRRGWTGGRSRRVPAVLEPVRGAGPPGADDRRARVGGEVPTPDRRVEAVGVRAQ